MLKAYVHEFVSRSPQEAKRRAFAAQQLKKNRNFRGDVDGNTEESDEETVSSDQKQDEAA